MASTRHIGRQNDSLCLASVLSSAVSEWLLIFLLFLNALFSYLVTKFARFCKLQTPCLLCSRLDHVFGNEKPGFYLEFICDSHKSEISLTFSGDGFRHKLNGEVVAEIPVLKKDAVTGYQVMEHCSCCSMTLRNKSYDLSLLHNSPNEADKNNCLHYQDRLSKTTKNSLMSPSSFHRGNNEQDHLSHIGNNEGKSDNPLADDDDDDSFVAKEVKEDPSESCLKLEPAPVTNVSISLSEDTSIQNWIHPSFINGENSLSVPEKLQIHVEKSYDASLASNVAIRHESGGSNWNANTTEPISEKVQSEIPNGKVTLNSSTETNGSTNQVTSNPSISVPLPMDLNDAYKLAVGSKGSLASPTVTEVITGRDSSKAYEDLKLLMSQFSSSRGLDRSWSELSPSPSPSSTPSSAVLQNITNSLSIERNESGFESLDGSMVSEIEGETAMERLKRQVELDRKSIYLLYKELEEERNASAIAANQAMAMITRLQEEKAAMQMEALQYQRMMEEQAEYDQEAMQKLSELLIRRENELQDLAEEIVRYKRRVGDGSVL